jgi:hypothetical protein
VDTFNNSFAQNVTPRSIPRKKSLLEKMFSMIASRLLIDKKTFRRESDSPDYNTVWYCLRLGSTDTFPDGRSVPVQRYKTSKPIWIKLGEGISWAAAITFGPTRSVMEEAAEDFGAEQIVWVDEKNKTDFPEKSQDTRSNKKRGVVNDA